MLRKKMKLRNRLWISALLMLLASSAYATPVYVGSWYVGEGPVWTDNPDVLNAQETAALLFGGDATDYVISTISDQVADINYMAFVDGWGDSTYLTTAVAQDYSLDSGAPGYNDPYGGPSYSAYVLDHSCSNRYSNPEEGCLTNMVGLNYAFRVNVPEPATLTLMTLGLAGFGFARKKRVA
ncbi:MAG: PEP-CTERM sorting domain-containing protein [Sedimenticola sp.]